MPGTRTLWTYVYLPVTLSGMSTRGTFVPMTLYWPTAFDGAAPGFSVGATRVVFNSFPPTSWPYVIDLPPPETTPSLTDRPVTATPRLTDASLSSACFAVAAAARSGGPPVDWMPLLPPVSPEFTTCHESNGPW